MDRRGELQLREMRRSDDLWKVEGEGEVGSKGY